MSPEFLVLNQIEKRLVHVLRPIFIEIDARMIGLVSRARNPGVELRIGPLQRRPENVDGANPDKSSRNQQSAREKGTAAPTLKKDGN